ncbi:carboxylesterase [Pelistega sp. NLN82]|uniref:Carboxylesterase n=1 Tax=Pelistega ratti TaxID=2652177 RepID=A0A6L9Y4E3_9BURK|nr:alpha/beta hydrolase [Pelistega ratti]NEN75340.1 carboxylesterase [Pelistega ratti]
MPNLETIEQQTADTVQYSIIWLHGLGADANDFVPIIPALNFSPSIGIRFIFPNAPVRPITINNGMVMRGWYDILSLERIESAEDNQGLYNSKQAIEALIQQENIRGIPSERIFLAGFSQGCAMSLFTGLRYSERLAGIIGLSGYLPLYKQTAIEASPINKDIPIFLAHGTVDPVVPLYLAQRSRDYLIEQGYTIQWHEYPMAHQVSNEEIVDIASFIHHIIHNK